MNFLILRPDPPGDAVCVYLQVHTHIVQFFRKFYIFGDAVIALDVRQYDFVSCELQLLNPCLM